MYLNYTKLSNKSLQVTPITGFKVNFPAMFEPPALSDKTEIISLPEENFKLELKVQTIWTEHQ